MFVPAYSHSIPQPSIHPIIHPSQAESPHSNHALVHVMETFIFGRPSSSYVYIAFHVPWDDGKIQRLVISLREKSPHLLTQLRI